MNTLKQRHIIALLDFERNENYLKDLKYESYQTYFKKLKTEDSPKTKAALISNENKENINIEPNILIKSIISKNSSFHYSNDKFKLSNFKNFFNSENSLNKLEMSNNFIFLH